MVFLLAGVGQAQKILHRHIIKICKSHQIFDAHAPSTAVQGMQRVVDLIILQVGVADTDAALRELFGKLFKGQLFFFAQIFQPFFGQRHPAFVI